jgi:hypothetical protein
MTVWSLKSKVQSPKSKVGGGCRMRLFLAAAASRLLAPVLSGSAAGAAAPEDIPRLLPPHAEIPPTFWEQYSLWVIIFGVVVLALVCVAAWFLTRPKSPVIVPPEVQARQALELLRQQPEDGARLSRVSQILRHYAAAVFDLPPGELTTVEFCRAMAGHSRIGLELSGALGEFLRQCDERKFSPPSPVPPFGAAARALQLIDQAEIRRLALAQSAAQPSQGSAASPPKAGLEK